MIISTRTKPRRVSVDRLPEYREWLREECKCVICSREKMCIRDPWLSIIDPCHTSNNGMRSKGADSGCAPLCRWHHNQLDGRDKLPNGEVGRKAFEAYYQIDMAREAAVHFTAFKLTKGEV